MAAFKQGSIEWLDFRLGKVTASNLGALLGQVSYISRRHAFAQILTTQSKNDVPALAWGRDNEKNGIAVYEHISESSVTETGVHTLPDVDWFAGSPDGLVGSDGIIEVKCPYYKKVVHKKVPIHYYMQMNACLEVTDREWCDFVSWTPWDVAIYRVHRDNETFQKLFPYYRTIHESIKAGDTTPPALTRAEKDKIRDIVQSAIDKNVDYAFYTG